LEDCVLTKRLREAGELLCVSFLDPLILANVNKYSFTDQRLALVAPAHQPGRIPFQDHRPSSPNSSLFISLVVLRFVNPQEREDS
jgi:hypothetical protein